MGKSDIIFKTISCAELWIWLYHVCRHVFTHAKARAIQLRMRNPRAALGLEDHQFSFCFCLLFFCFVFLLLLLYIYKSLWDGPSVNTALAKSRLLRA